MKHSEKINFFSHPDTLHFNVLKDLFLARIPQSFLNKIGLQNQETGAKVKKSPY